jgi:hypothetical protein
MHLFLPKFEGALLLPRIPDGFFERVTRRVHEGLFIRGSRNRANYTVQRAERYDVRFTAADVSTAINVGLNEVRVYRVDDQRIGYSVTFWKWTLYAVVLCAVIGLTMAAAFFLWPALRGETATWGKTGAYLFWGMLAFWGLAWPWLLTAMHKRPAARCLENILRDELAQIDRQHSTSV